MKTAEELSCEIANIELIAHESDVNLFHPKIQQLLVSLVKQIQLDAYKAGMSEAAEIARHDFGNIMGEIFAARDRKTSL